MLSGLGIRLKRIGTRRDITLAELAAATGISKSTWSRLECEQRESSLELLLPILQAHVIPLDELVGSAEVGDPRIRLKPQRRCDGRVVVSLAAQPRTVHACKAVVPPQLGKPPLRSHERHEWLSVLSAYLRRILADHDVAMQPGEVAEFDTQVPHWFGPGADRPVEIVSILGRDGERVHVRPALRHQTAER